MRPATGILAALLLALAAAAQQDDYADASPYMTNPRLADLMADVTFFVSFDGDTLKPELAAGAKGLLHEQPPYGVKPGEKPPPLVYEPGIVGQALRADSGGGEYAVQDNLPLATSGAIAFWMKPIDWSGTSNSTFFRLGGGTFLGVMRQALLKNDKGKIIRHENFMAYARQDRNDNRGAGAGGSLGTSREGRWYFVVLNWAWPTIAMSIDGRPFASGKALTGLPPWRDKVNTFYLGSRGGGPTLVDEVMIFKRPLDQSEAALLHDTVVAWAAKKQPARQPTTEKEPAP